MSTCKVPAGCATMTAMTWGPGAVGPETAARWGRWGPRPEDVLLALASAVLALVSLTGRISPLGESDEDWLHHFRGPTGWGSGWCCSLQRDCSSAGASWCPWRSSTRACSSCTRRATSRRRCRRPSWSCCTRSPAPRGRSSGCAASVTALSIVVADLLHDVSLDDDKLVAYLLAVLLASWSGTSSR